jgi:exoribonuclease-2
MQKRLTLDDLAKTAMTERGLWTDFPPDVSQQLEMIDRPAAPRMVASFRDMRRLPWISIDNDDSRDLDQLTAVENAELGKNRLFIAIADVDEIVKRDSAIDRYAAHNTASVYTPARVFSMLPPKLCYDLTSLVEGNDRFATVVEIMVDEQGKYDLVDIFPAWVRNKAKLSYRQTAEWLERDIRFPLSEMLLQQLKEQDAIASRIQRFREQQGMLEFETIEVQPVVVENRVVRLEPQAINRAHRLIENCMIVANVCMTRYFVARGLPVMRRIVRTPKRWSRIVQLAIQMGDKLPSRPHVRALSDFLSRQRAINPDGFSDLSLSIIKLLGRGEYVLGIPGGPALGHFDLALRDYAHSTAPNRRFADLVMQRLLKSHLYGEPVPYRRNELVNIASHCTLKENDVAKVERRLLKCAAAMILTDQIGRRYRAMVTGASPKGTWVRVVDPLIEGRLIRGFKGVDVGDWIEVELVRVDIHNGHIDFRR